MIKPIKDFEGYFISDNGKVYCNLGKGNRKNGKTVELYEIKPRLTKNGYARVCMRNSITNKRMDKYIHRLVAEYFLEGEGVVDHIDGNAANNKRDNLRCICPNCDSQLDTYKSKNKNGARSYYRYHKEDPINKIGK